MFGSSAVAETVPRQDCNRSTYLDNCWRSREWPVGDMWSGGRAGVLLRRVHAAQAAQTAQAAQAHRYAHIRTHAIQQWCSPYSRAKTSRLPPQWADSNAAPSHTRSDGTACQWSNVSDGYAASMLYRHSSERAWKSTLHRHSSGARAEQRWGAQPRDMARRHIHSSGSTLTAASTAA